MDWTATYEAYMLFRMSEPSWVEQSANPAYERHLMDHYDASLKTNSQCEPDAQY